MSIFDNTIKADNFTIFPSIRTGVVKYPFIPVDMVMLADFFVILNTETENFHQKLSLPEG